MGAFQQELEHLERKYAHTKRALNQLLAAGQSGTPPGSPPLAIIGRRESGSRAGSLQFEASPEPAIYSATGPLQPPAKSRLELVASMSAPAAAAKLPLQQQPPRTSDHWPEVADCRPMSLEERLQLSSSTPPQRNARQSVRRRLPPQPTAYATACLSPSPSSGAQCSSNSLDRLMADQQGGQVEGDTQCYAALGTGALHQHQQPRRPGQLPVVRAPFAAPLLYPDKMLPAEAAGDDELQSELQTEPQVQPQVHQQQRQQRYSFQQDAHLALKSELEMELVGHLEPPGELYATHNYHLQQQQQQQQHHQQPPPLTDNNGRLLLFGDDFTTDQLLLGDPHQPYEHYNRLQ